MVSTGTPATAVLTISLTSDRPCCALPMLECSENGVMDNIDVEVQT